MLPPLLPAGTDALTKANNVRKASASKTALGVCSWTNGSRRGAQNLHALYIIAQTSGRLGGVVVAAARDASRAPQASCATSML
jgi:hypothetical protein